LQGPRRRQGGSVRVDIPAWRETAEEVVCFLLALFERRDSPPDAVIRYLCKDPVAGGSPRAVAEALRLLVLMLAAGVPLHESLCLSEGRWFSYFRDEAPCCSPEGPRSSTSPVAAAVAFAGIQVQGSLRELEPVPAATADPLPRAFERETPVVAAELGREGGRDRLRSATRSPRGWRSAAR
jgi:hypothetical protein